MPIGRADVTADGGESDRTLVRVVARDQVGLLATICRYFADHGLSVESVHAATDGANRPRRVRDLRRVLCIRPRAASVEPPLVGCEGASQAIGEDGLVLMQVRFREAWPPARSR